MALKLDILANTRQFVSEMKKSGASVEDISDELDDLKRDGEKAFTKLEAGFRDMARDAKKADDSIAKIGTDGFKKAGKGADEFGRESNSTLRETAASISSVEDGLGAVQEIAANAFAGFGPVGAGAGLVAALGFGLLLENLNQQNEAIQRMKQYFADAYQTAASEGRDYLDVATIIGEAQDIQFNPDRQSEYNQALEQSKKLGISVNDVVLARAGDQDALRVVIEATEEAQKSLDKTTQGAGRFTHQKNETEVKELDRIQRQYQQIGEEHKKNAEKARNSQDILSRLNQEQRDQIKRTQDADSARWSAYAANVQANKDRAIAAGEQIRQNISRPITTDLRIRTTVDRTAIDQLQRRLNEGFSVVVRPGQVAWN